MHSTLILASFVTLFELHYEMSSQVFNTSGSSNMGLYGTQFRWWQERLFMDDNKLQHN
jgi:hypothetical protein